MALLQQGKGAPALKKHRQSAVRALKKHRQSEEKESSSSSQAGTPYTAVYQLRLVHLESWYTWDSRVYQLSLSRGPQCTVYHLFCGQGHG